MKDKALEYLNQNMLCVVSTVTADAKSESAYVGFSCNDKFEIIFGTSSKTRKYQNLLKNPAISVVVAGTTAEVQYEGEAALVSAQEYEELIENNHLKKVPGASKYRDDPDQVYFKVAPTWLRFTQHIGGINQIDEMTEF